MVTGSSNDEPTARRVPARSASPKLTLELRVRKRPPVKSVAAPKAIPDEPKGWRRIWEKTQTERDPKKLIQLLDQLNHLLSENERKTEHKPPPAVSKRGTRPRAT